VWGKVWTRAAQDQNPGSSRGNHTAETEGKLRAFLNCLPSENKNENSLS